MSIVEKNFKLLTESKDKFKSYVDFYFSKPKFSGPSVYFHEKTIGFIRNTDNFEDLILSIPFCESCYATLTSWGLHQMSPRSAKLKNFNIFLDEIKKNKSKILYLRSFQLKNLSETEKNSIVPEIGSLFENLKIMASNSNFVGNSKLIHHILPDLVPPMDREHTLIFFYSSKTINNTDETPVFLEIFEKYWQICNILQLQDTDYKTYPSFTTSIPKLIDNAIVGCVMKENLNKKK